MTGVNGDEKVFRAMMDYSFDSLCLEEGLCEEGLIKMLETVDDLHRGEMPVVRNQSANER